MTGPWPGGDGRVCGSGSRPTSSVESMLALSVDAIMELLVRLTVQLCPREIHLVHGRPGALSQRTLDL